MPEVESGGARIHYEIHDETGGRGVPLLCIMGMGGSSKWWFPQVEGLRDRHRILTFDNRGVGRSDKPQGPYTMGQMAADALAVLDAAGVQRAHVMGISLGGMVAQHVALDAPERVSKLVLACTTAGGPTSVQPPAEVTSAFMSMGGMPMGDPRLLLEKLGWVIFPRPWLEQHRERVAELLEALAEEPAPMHALFGQLMAMVGHDTRARLPAISHETLVLSGDEDVLVPLANARILVEGIPNARLEVIEGTGHGFNLQAPEAFNRAVDDFLA